MVAIVAVASSVLVALFEVVSKRIWSGRRPAAVVLVLFQALGLVVAAAAAGGKRSLGLLAAATSRGGRRGFRIIT